MDQLVNQLKKRLRESAYISSALALLQWDQEVLMPPKGVEIRSHTIAHLSGMAHSSFLAVNKDGLLDKLKKLADDQKSLEKLNEHDRAIVLETWRTYERLSKLPEDFVKELAEIASRSNAVWAEARAKDDFASFRPWLEKIVALKRKEAKLVGFDQSPYDALLDAYEPRMTAAAVSQTFAELKDFLVPYLAKIKKARGQSSDKSILHGNFPADKQMEFSVKVAEAIGFDSTAGRIDVSAHPFTTNFHPLDVRFTTRINEHDIMPALGATIHETGHALYEQGLDHEHFGTPLGESISLGIHESQSRFWENCIGKSEAFWRYFYPMLVAEFLQPFSKIPLDTFYRAINQVMSGLIRIEADEVTYNLHIIIRFEIEKELIEGSIEVKDLPAIWRSKMRDYLGIDVPSDSVGVLQDTHWAQGLIGYFPTYTLGNLYSAQFFRAMKKALPDLEKQTERGEFSAVLSWMRKNIHQHGKFYTADSLVLAVTGEPLTSKYFIEYIKDKYDRIYGI